MLSFLTQKIACTATSLIDATPRFSGCVKIKCFCVGGGTGCGVAWGGVSRGLTLGPCSLIKTDRAIMGLFDGCQITLELDSSIRFKGKLELKKKVTDNGGLISFIVTKKVIS